MEKIKYIDLDSIWDPSIIDTEPLQEFIKYISDNRLDKGSWFLHMMNEDKMFEDEDFLEIFKDCTKYDIGYYFALMRCDIYSAFLGLYLKTKFPDTEWRVVYFVDHYVVVKLEELKSYVFYDLLYYSCEKAGIPYGDESEIPELLSFKTVDEQIDMIKKDGYDGFGYYNFD